MTERSRLIPTSTLHEIHRLVSLRDDDTIALHVGEPHMGVPESAREALVRAVRDGRTTYTDSSGLVALCEALTAKLAKRNQVTTAPERVFVSPGSCEALVAIMQSVAVEGNVALLPEVHWPIHHQQVRLAGLVPRFYPSVDGDAGALTEHLDALFDERVSLIVVNSPANPSGRVLSPAVLREIHEWAVRRRVWIISDEAYEDFVFGGPTASIGAYDAELPDAQRVVFSVYTFSKGYSMTGYRLGYTAAPTRERAELLRRVQEATLVSPSTPVQYAGLAALDDHQHVAAHRRYVRETRDEVVRLLDDADLVWRQPMGGWYALLDLSRHTDDTEAFCLEVLDDTGVALAAGHGFFPPDHPTGRRLARLTLCAERERTLEGVRRLTKHLQ